MKKSLAVALSLLSVFAGAVEAASCTVNIPFPAQCVLWYGYGDGADPFTSPKTVTLSGDSGDNWDKPTHLNCTLGQSVAQNAGVRLTGSAGWILVKDGKFQILHFQGLQAGFSSFFPT